MGVSLPSGTVTFLFTDIEGSTALWESDPEAMRTALERHDAILNATIDSHDGYVFSTGGDGVAAAFAWARDALDAAVEAQEALTTQSWVTPVPLRVRMGVHTGEATERDGDYFGPTVNRAARLMAAGHGGQVLVSASTAVVVGETRLLDLGQHRLRDLAEPQRVFQVGAIGFPPLRSMDVALTNLTVQATALIGRQPLIAEMAAVVERDPLVTLTGVGGVGKTRLALEVGAELLPKFADGVWLVELAPVAQEGLVLAVVAEVLGAAPQTGEPLAKTIVSRMVAKHLLVILDNCEHVLGPVAQLADQLVAKAPGVRILATSREPLGVAAERVRAVPSLAETTEAVELFVERAARSGAVVGTAAQLEAVREICKRLDGLPLAIELAAARARMMAPVQIAERLDHRFRLLTGGGRGAVERHRTLQATVAWSYELLDSAERIVFERLSTMAGTFDLEAAEAVGAGGEVEAAEVLDALGHLVDKSMVLTVTDSSGAIRYRMLETLRQFGADRLAERVDAAHAYDGHAHYWRDRAVRLGRDAVGSDQAAVLDALDADIDNYRAAFAHLLAGGQINDAARGILALGLYWQVRRAPEGLRWTEQLLALAELDPRRRLRVLAQAAHLAACLGDTYAAERCAAEAIAAADSAGVDPPWPAAEALLFVASVRRDKDAYRYWYERTLQVSIAGGERYTQLLTEAQRWGMSGTGRCEELVAHYDRVLVEVLDLGDPLLVATTAGSMAWLLNECGEDERCLETIRAAIDYAERAGPTTNAGVTWTCAAVLTLRGELAAARPLLARTLRLAADEGLTLDFIQCLFVAAAFAARLGDLESTATLLTGGDRHAEPLGVRGGRAHDCRFEAQAALEAYDGDLSTAQLRGETMTINALADYAIQALEALSVVA